jgi:hypothetical protein
MWNDWNAQPQSIPREPYRGEFGVRRSFDDPPTLPDGWEALVSHLPSQHQPGITAGELAEVAGIDAEEVSRVLRVLAEAEEYGLGAIMPPGCMGEGWRRATAVIHHVGCGA